jgi:uncharacterized membrane protein
MSDTHGYVIILHIVGMVLWMGFLPYRNLLLSVARGSDSFDVRRRALDWERKLWRFLFVPGVVAVATSGVYLAAQSTEATAGWLPWKLVAVAIALGLELSTVRFSRLRTAVLVVAEGRRDRARVAAVDEFVGRALTGSCVELVVLVVAVLISILRAAPPLPLAVAAVGAAGLVAMHLAAVRRLPSDIGRVIPNA